MTIKELITRLLDEPMDSEIVLHIAKEHTDSHGLKINGYFFNIRYSADGFTRENTT